MTGKRNGRYRGALAATIGRLLMEAAEQDTMDDAWTMAERSTLVALLWAQPGHTFRFTEADRMALIDAMEAEAKTRLHLTYDGEAREFTLTWETEAEHHGQTA